MNMDIEINILFIGLAAILIWRIVSGYRKGMAKELISFITLIALSVAVILLGYGLKSYMKKEIVQTVMAVILILVLIIVYKLLDFFFFTAEACARLPVVKTADKILGSVIGIAETVILIWAVYGILETFDTGSVGAVLWNDIRRNVILKELYGLYEKYPAQWIAGMLREVEKLPFRLFEK